MIPRVFRIAVFAAACAVVLWLSLAPTQALPSVSQWDKVEHAAAYLALAVLGVWATPGGRWPIAAGLFGLGVGIELLQAAMGWGRHGDPVDVLANSLGIVLGLLLTLAFREAIKVKARARGE